MFSKLFPNFVKKYGSQTSHRWKYNTGHALSKSDTWSEIIDTHSEYLIFNYFWLGGSILFAVTGILHWRNSSDRTMALELTQPLTENDTKNISRREGLQPYYLHVPSV
jgi:hypothetical protein